MKTEEKEVVFAYLDELRSSGETNMFGAGAYVEQTFPQVTRDDARRLLAEWMRTFDERSNR